MTREDFIWGCALGAALLVTMGLAPIWVPALIVVNGIDKIKGER